MKRLFLIILSILLLVPVIAKGEDYFTDNINLRSPKTVYLPKGTFIKVTNIKEITSQLADAGDEAVMTSTFDVYIGETKIIPQKSIFYGIVEKVQEPVQGTNASLTIKMNKMVTPEGISYPLSGYISQNGTNLSLGGDRTASLYYTRMPHYTRWSMNRWKIGATQYCETNTRVFGTHITIKPGAELILVLQDNLEF